MAEIIRIRHGQGNIVNVADKTGKILASFEIKENLDGALALLKQINALKTKTGLPIYQTATASGVSTWPFHQQILYLPTLTELVKHEEIIKYLRQREKGFIVELDGASENLARYLSALGIPSRMPNPGRRFVKRVFKKVFNAIGKFLSFLITAAAAVKLRLGAERALIYTPDKLHKTSGGDFRVKAIYDYLHSHNVEYLEIFHSLYGREFFGNLFRRKRLAIYLESLDIFGFLWRTPRHEYDLAAFPIHLRSIISDLLKEIEDKSRSSQRVISALIKIFKPAKITRVICVDDMRHVGAIIAAGRHAGVKVYGFQHGHITKYHAGWMNYGIPKERSAAFDALFVWNDYWKHSLVRHSSMYDDGNVRVGGPLRPPPEIAYKKRGAPLDNIQDAAILVPYESIAPKEEIAPFLAKMRQMGARLIFKPRPDVPVERQLSEYGLNREQIKISEKLDSELLSEVDAVIGVYTTFLYELIFYEKPVFILKTSFTLGSPLLEDGLGVELEPDFTPRFLLDHINNYASKKAAAWPPAPKLEETLKNFL